MRYSLNVTGKCSSRSNEKSPAVSAKGAGVGSCGMDKLVIGLARSPCQFAGGARHFFVECVKKPTDNNTFWCFYRLLPPVPC
jgi:hypothetical protein